MGGPLETLSLFDGLPTVGATRARPASVAQPAVRRDAQRQYDDWRSDVDRLAEAWEELHVWFLQRHLRMLASPHTEAVERADILAWLEAPLVSGQPAALSAQACLGVYDGRIDVAEFQRQVRRLSQRVAAQRRAA